VLAVHHVHSLGEDTVALDVRAFKLDVVEETLQVRRGDVRQVNLVSLCPVSQIDRDDLRVGSVQPRGEVLD